jgi:hypothetical protein
MHDFLKFTQTNSKQDSHITVTASSSFGFTSRFCLDINIDQFQFVTLFYDSRSMAVGFHFHSNPAEQHKFKIVRGKKYGAYILATSFFKANNIDPAKYRGRYEWIREGVMGVGDVYAIELKIHEEKSDEVRVEDIPF